LRRVQWRRGLLLLFCVVVVAASAHVSPARAVPGLLVGVDDDTVKWMARPNGLVTTYRDLGLDAVRVTIPWRRGRTRPNRVVGLYLHRAASLIARGQRVVLGVYGSPSQAPVTDREQHRYCSFVAHVLERMPIRDVVVWNEANSPAFWPDWAGPEAYEQLLATCWDRLHRVRADVNVISSTAAHYDAAGFMLAVGSAYRASGRAQPLVDTFGHNPYPDFAVEPPWVQHPDSATIAQGDLDRLVTSIGVGFAGTAQPVPAPDHANVWYLEDGFQTAVPAAKRRLYRGIENDRTVLPALAPASRAAVARDQATQLRDALLLASCQPAVGAFFNFELIDEDRLAGWQSGLLWRDGTHKPSYQVFKDALRRIRSGTVSCSTVTGSHSSAAYRSPHPCRVGPAVPVSAFWPRPPRRWSGA
jgi:hypothetical protein